MNKKQKLEIELEVSVINFDQAGNKYHCDSAMRDILFLYRTNPGRLIAFNDLLEMTEWPRNTLRKATADLRRLNYRQFVTPNADLRLQYRSAT